MQSHQNYENSSAEFPRHSCKTFAEEKKLALVLRSGYCIITDSNAGRGKGKILKTYGKAHFLQDVLSITLVELRRTAFILLKGLTD